MKLSCSACDIQQFMQPITVNRFTGLRPQSTFQKERGIQEVRFYKQQYEYFHT